MKGGLFICLASFVKDLLKVVLTNFRSSLSPRALSDICPRSLADS